MPAKAAASKKTGSGETQQPDPRLLELLVCPLTKKPLVFEKAAAELVSPAAGVAFPIRDGIPVMLEEEARSLSETERAKYKSK